jgi:hypothetical protein
MAQELDGLAGDRLDRQRRATAGVAVELGHDEAVMPTRSSNSCRRAHRVLPDHRVDHEQDVVGLVRFLISSSSVIRASSMASRPRCRR